MIIEIKVGLSIKALVLGGYSLFFMMFVPLNKISPVVGSKKAQINFSKTVFPDPLWPINP